MKVSELIKKLQSLPQDADVYISSNDGCSHCNEDGLPYYHGVYDPQFMEEGEYPHYDLKNIVVIC